MQMQSSPRAFWDGRREFGESASHEPTKHWASSEVQVSSVDAFQGCQKD